MQTAMQELIEWAISLQYKQQQCTDWIVIKNKAESLLEKEKDWIIHTYWVAYKEGRYSGDKTAEEYYNETYNI
jgi:hypothetical protein